jgi:hypothetical protein
MYYVFVLSYGFISGPCYAGLYSDAAMGVAGVLVFMLVSVASRSLHRQYQERRGHSR